MEIAKRPVVADPDTAFLQKLFYECGESPNPPLVVNSAEKLQDIIQREPHLVSGVFLNPRLASGISTMRALRENLPNAPLFYIIEETMHPPDESDLHILTVAECLKKPFRHSEIERALTQSITRLGKAGALAANDPLNQEFGESDENFYPVRAKNFIQGKESFFDLYTRVQPGRFIKVLGAGELFTRDLLERQLRRGMDHFFIRREIQHKHLEHSRKVTEALLGNQQTSAGDPVAGPIQLGQEGSEFLRSNGIKDAEISYALQFAKKALAQSIKLAKDEYVLKHLGDPANLDHSISVAMFASLIAARMKLDQSRATGIVGVSAILHDVGMIHIAKELHHINPADLNCEELDIYEAHPTIGQEMLKNIPGLDPAIALTVGQHHERLSGKGFPNKPASVAIEAEIVGLSEEFLKLLIRARKDPAIDPLKKMERRLSRFSPAAVAAFRGTFSQTSSPGQKKP